MVHLIMQDSIHGISLYSTNIKIEFHIVWHPSPPSFYELNVNGYHNTTTRSTNCGGLIRESFNNIINKFHYNIGTSNVIKGGAREGVGSWFNDHLRREVGDGSFVYNYLTSSDQPLNKDHTTIIWYKEVSLKVNIFTCSLLRNRLPTTDNLIR